MKYDFESLRDKLKKELDEHRFYHSLGVAHTSAFMAYLYDTDPEQALIAGLLHDCGKCVSNDKKLSLCKKEGFPISDVEKENPSLLHGKVGRIYAAEKYGIEDEDMLNAITYHTTGRPGMSTLEKIVFVADYVEPGRKDRPGMELEEVRYLAYHDLDAAVLRILSDSLTYLSSTDRPIDDTTQKTYDYYAAKRN